MPQRTYFVQQEQYGLMPLVDTWNDTTIEWIAMHKEGML
jgi:hypothetical protein